MTSGHIALRKAAEMALEELGKTMGVWGGTCAWHNDVEKAIDALKEALAQLDRKCEAGPSLQDLWDCWDAVHGVREPAARLIYWHGPAHYPIPHNGVAARTFSEFSKEAADDPDSYWKNGEPLYLHPAQIPEGWQLVPKEPTDEMINAAEEVRQYELSTHWRRWAAMLAAAPKPEE